LPFGFAFVAPAVDFFASGADFFAVAFVAIFSKVYLVPANGVELSP